MKRTPGWIYLTPSEAPRRRSAAARDLRSPKYRLRVVKSRKAYTRKRKHQED
jgi:hypothetical protein